MYKNNVKIVLEEVIRKMIFDYKKDGYIYSLRQYSDEQGNTDGVPYGYLRKMVDSGVLVYLKGGKKNMQYKWNESLDPTEDELKFIANKIINYSKQNTTELPLSHFHRGLSPKEAMGIGLHSSDISKEDKHSLPFILSLYEVLKKHEIPKEKIEIIIKDIQNI